MTDILNMDGFTIAVTQLHDLNYINMYYEEFENFQEYY